MLILFVLKMPGRGRGLKNVQKEAIPGTTMGNVIGFPSAHVSENNTNVSFKQLIVWF